MPETVRTLESKCNKQLLFVKIIATLWELNYERNIT
jgi:hypothetical protein